MELYSLKEKVLISEVSQCVQLQLNKTLYDTLSHCTHRILGISAITYNINKEYNIKSIEVSSFQYEHYE